MEEHQAALEQKVSDRTVELASTNMKLDKMTTHINTLTQAIKEQEMSVADISKLESEIKGLSEAMDRAVDTKEQQENVLLESEKELVSSVNSLDATLSKYNNKVSELEIVAGLESTLEGAISTFNHDKLLDKQQSAFLGIDLHATVNPNATSSISHYQQELDSTKKQYDTSVGKKEMCEGDLLQSKTKLSIASGKKAKCQETLREESETMDAKLAVRSREVEAMEHKIRSLQDPVALEEQMASYGRQCVELEAARVELHNEAASKRQAMLDEINAACAAMMNHDAHHHACVASVTQAWKLVGSKLQ